MGESKVFSPNYPELLPLGNSSFLPVDPPTQRVIRGIGSKIQNQFKSINLSSVCGFY